MAAPTPLATPSPKSRAASTNSAAPENIKRPCSGTTASWPSSTPCSTPSSFPMGSAPPPRFAASISAADACHRPARRKPIAPNWPKCCNASWPISTWSPGHPKAAPRAPANRPRTSWSRWCLKSCTNWRNGGSFERRVGPDRNRRLGRGYGSARLHGKNGRRACAANRTQRPARRVPQAAWLAGRHTGGRRRRRSHRQCHAGRGDRARDPRAFARWQRGLRSRPRLQSAFRTVHRTIPGAENEKRIPGALRRWPARNARLHGRVGGHRHGPQNRRGGSAGPRKAGRRLYHGAHQRRRRRRAGGHRRGQSQGGRLGQTDRRARHRKPQRRGPFFIAEIGAWNIGAWNSDTGLAALIQSLSMRKALFILAISGAATLAAAAVDRKDVEYTRPGGKPVLLDLHVPDGPGPFPAAILIHGGGFDEGSKSTNVRPLFDRSEEHRVGKECRSRA